MNSLTNIVSIDKLIRYKGEQLTVELGYKPRQLYNRKVPHDIALIRGVMMYHFRWSCRYTTRECSEVFNMNPSSCAYWCKKISDYESINDAVVMEYIQYIKP
jgi:hypothetical protein